jgi:hypothetical protein
MGKAEQDALLAEFGVLAAEPVAPKVASETLPTSSARDELMADFAPVRDRAPTVSTDALKEDLAKGGAVLANATMQERLDEGASQEDAERAAEEVRSLSLVLSKDADTARVRRQLEAHLGTDTAAKVFTRAFGQRLMEVPIVEPEESERWDKQRELERENRTSKVFIDTAKDAGIGALKAMAGGLPAVYEWATKEEDLSEARAPETGEVRSWMDAPSDSVWQSAANAAGGGLPALYDLSERVRGFSEDKDVQALTRDWGAQSAMALLSRSGLTDIAEGGMAAIGADTPSMAEFWDNTREKPEFDAAALALYQGDPTKLEAIRFSDLPEMAKRATLDPERFREAIRNGDPDVAALAGLENKSDGYLIKQAANLPIATIRRIQADAVPSAVDIESVFKRREGSKDWRGTDQAAAAGNLMNALLLRPVGNGDNLVVVPSRLQEAIRWGNTGVSMLSNIDIGTEDFGPLQPILNLPTALPRAAMYAADAFGVEGAAELAGQIENARTPTPAGIETMITIGRYDNILDAAGLATSDLYARRYDPGSTWLSRTLTEIGNPDMAGQKARDTYERLGGDPNSATARMLGLGDFAVDVLLPAEELVMMPATSTVAAVNRGRRYANAARELGMNPQAAKRGAFRAAVSVGDPRAAAAEMLTSAALEGIRDGTLDPARIPAATKKAVEDVLREARVPNAEIATIWDTLADRRARILDTATDLEHIGGPMTQALRKSPAYLARRADLDKLVAAGNLAPRDRDLTMRFLEASAFRAAEDGRVPTPEDYFARHSWEVGKEGEALPTGTLNQTTTVRSGEESMKKYGLEPGKKYTNRQVAEALEKRQRAKYGSIAREDRSPEARAKIANWIADEVEFSTENPKGNGVGWYSTEFQRAIDTMAEEFPQLKTDPDQRDILTAIIALTSDGQKPKGNLHQAADIYAEYAKTGTFTSNRGHVRSESVDRNLARLQDLYSDMTPAEVRDFLLQEVTYSDYIKALREAGLKTPKKMPYQAHVKIPRAVAVLGPKLGAFYANLMGSSGYLTMDRWWSRTFNRYRGSVLRHSTDNGIARVKSLLGRPEMSDKEMMAKVDAIRKDYERRDFKGGTPLEIAANTVWKNANELLDSPFGAPDRTFMIDTVREAQRVLRQRGLAVSAADIQAILWYYEKRLYGELGARPAPDVSFADVAAAVLAERRSGQVRPAGRGKPGVGDDGTTAVRQSERDFEEDPLDAADEDVGDLPFEGDAEVLFSRKGDTIRGAISPDARTVTVDNPDYAAWVAREAALSAEVDALRNAPEVPNPARAEWEAKGKATADEVAELKRAGSEEMANLQARRESLQKNARPDDPDWEAEVEEVNERIGEITRTTNVNPTLAAKEAELAALRANPPASTLPTDPNRVVGAKAEALARLRRFEIPKTITKPDDVSRWLLKLFRTGDVKTALHEGTHLLDLMMGEEWTRKAMEALGYDPTGPITTEVRERIAEAGTRALRGTLRPGTVLGNVMEDLRDTVGDLWRRVKNEPAITTPKFRKLLDKTFAPDDAGMMVAAHLVDSRQPSRVGRIVSVASDTAEEIRKGAQRAAGQAEQAAGVMRAGSEVRQALGIADDVTELPLGDVLARAIGFTATTHALRGWGWGELEGLTARTAVPAARAKIIREQVAAERRALLGGKTPPRSVGGVYTLTPEQQTGLRIMLARLRNEPISTTLPARLLEPGADLSHVSDAEWASVAQHQLEVRAGMDAFRDRIAERAAVTGGVRLVQLIGDYLRDPRMDTSQMANQVRDAFVLSTGADEYINPAQREMFAAVEREIGESGRRVVNRIVKAMNEGGKSWQEAFKMEAAAMPPAVVMVDDLDTLAAADPMVNATSIEGAGDSIESAAILFQKAPVGSHEQTVQELAGVNMLLRVRAEMQGGADFSAALSNAGVTADQAADAMARVQEGVRRRVAAVESVGTDILLAFAGSDDAAALGGMSPGELSKATRKAYANWHTGDWDQLLLTNTREGRASTGPIYDQGRAALAVLVRLEAKKVLAGLARKMAEAGIIADTTDVLRGGVRMDQPYVFGEFRTVVKDEAAGVRPGKLPVGMTGVAYEADVQHYIEAITGWKLTGTARKKGATTPGEWVPATGERAPSGTVNVQAYGDACRILQSYGYKIGKGMKWEAFDLPDGGRIIVPSILREPIEKAVLDSAPLSGAFGSPSTRLGEIVPGTDKSAPIDIIAANKAIRAVSTGYAYSMGMLKTGLTSGIGPLIRPGFFVGNFVGGMFQLYQGVGAVDALRIMARPLLPTAEGATVRKVIARMWNNGEGAFADLDIPVFLPAESGFFDPVGVWHAHGPVADGAVAAGLNSSLVKTEFAGQLVDDIRNAEPTLWNRLMDMPGAKAVVGGVVGGMVGGPGGAVVGAGAFASLSRTWQGFVREAATGIDNYYRVATYVDALKRGIPEAEAANLARRVAFDYNAMTDFEKKYLRKAVLFYSFQRNNQNLFWWTLLNHPSRVMNQLRLLNGMQRENLGNDAELFAPEWGDGRIVFNWREPLMEGHAAEAKNGAVTLSPMMPIGDGIGILQSLLATVTELDPASAGDLAGRLGPWFQLPFVISTGTDPRVMRSIEGFNTIPNWMMDMDANLTGGMVTKGVFGATMAQTRNPATQDYPNAPQWIVKPDGPHARAWWFFRQMTMGGSTMDTITAMQRADAGQTFVEGGVVQGAVRASRAAAPLLGNEPSNEVEDTGMARSGLTENEELLGWLGFKPVQVPTREEALAPLIRQKKGDNTDKQRTLDKEAERRYQ